MTIPIAKLAEIIASVTKGHDWGMILLGSVAPGEKQKEHMSVFKSSELQFSP